MTQTEALRLALDALEYHTEQTRPIPYTIAAIVKIKAALEANNKSVDFYGYCPICNAKGLSRERHPDGSDVCTNGHIYESKYALTTPPQRTWIKLTDEQFLEACQMAEDGNYMVAFQRIQQWLKENNT